MHEREAMTRAVSERLDGRPVRWFAGVTGDFDGRERTLEVFDAEPPEQRSLIRDLRPLREQLSVAAGGPVVVVFHTQGETQRLYGEFSAAWRRRRLADRVAPRRDDAADEKPALHPEDFEPFTPGQPT